jgi:hypothetical protein
MRSAAPHGSVALANSEVLTEQAPRAYMSSILVRQTDIARQLIQFPTLRRKRLAFKTNTTIDRFLASFELRQRELCASVSASWPWLLS